MESMRYLDTTDLKAVALVTAIQTGDLETLKQILASGPDLSQIRIGHSDDSRSLLHIATDWPGHFPNVAETIKLLAESGADLNAAYEGPRHEETPLHWAASCDDVAAIDALLDAGADIEAPGSIFYNGTAIADATIFSQWKAARRLYERGAKSNLTESATLGLLDRVEKFVLEDSENINEISHAFWMACHGGQTETAKYLLEKGADKNWIPHWENFTPLDAAVRNKMTDTVEWLLSIGASHAKRSHT